MSVRYSKCVYSSVRCPLTEAVGDEGGGAGAGAGEVDVVMGFCVCYFFLFTADPET